MPEKCRSALDARGRTAAITPAGRRTRLHAVPIVEGEEKLGEQKGRHNRGHDEQKLTHALDYEDAGRAAQARPATRDQAIIP